MELKRRQQRGVIDGNGGLNRTFMELKLMLGLLIIEAVFVVLIAPLWN